MNCKLALFWVYGEVQATEQTFFFLIILEKPILSPKMFKTSTTGKQFDKEKLFRKILMIYYYDFGAKAIQVATDPIWPRLFRRL